jgi:hypothetical protein
MLQWAGVRQTGKAGKKREREEGRMKGSREGRMGNLATPEKK